MRAPPTEAPDVIRTRRMAYYRYMSKGPRPGVAVVEDLDGAAAIGAYWGEINTTIHKGFGLSGALTNGVMRDLGDLPEGFPVVAGSIGPSHGFVHVRDLDCEVRIFGLSVRPGELIHADRHGALVIPEDVVGGLHYLLVPPAGIFPEQRSIRWQDRPARVVWGRRWPNPEARPCGRWESRWPNRSASCSRYYRRR